MKKINFILFCSFVGILLGCNQESEIANNVEVFDGSVNFVEFDPSEIETPYNKEFSVFDESGKYFVKMNIGAYDEGVVDEYLSFVEYKLFMTYPGEDLTSDANETELTGEITQNDNSGSIEFKFKELNLDPKADGFYLSVSHNRDKIKNSRVASYTKSNDYNSPSRWMYWGRVVHRATNNNNPDFRVIWMYRNCSTCKMRADYDVILGPGQSSVYNKYDVRRIRARIHHNWFNYYVYFKKWESDGWGSPLSPS